MSTIREVAEKAGVSFTTVSHVLNNTRFVSSETRQRVMLAMRDLNYRPNAIARSLRRGETHTLGLILPDSSNPYFAEIARSVEDSAFRLGYSVIFCNSEREPDKELFYADLLCKKQVDGILFMTTAEHSGSLKLLLEQEVPLVLIDRDLPEPEVDLVLTDNCEGGRVATRHLLALGHRCIACIGGSRHQTGGGERVTGYLEALAQAGIAPQEQYIAYGDYHVESGLQGARALLQQKHPPSAIFACNDLMAIGVIHTAASLGVAIPGQLSLVGFDDIELAAYTSPPLTTVAQPKIEIGQQAVQLLIERIQDRSLAPRRLALPTRLIVRGSSGPAPNLL